MRAQCVCLSPLCQNGSPLSHNQSGQPLACLLRSLTRDTGFLDIQAAEMSRAGRCWPSRLIFFNLLRCKNLAGNYHMSKNKKLLHNRKIPARPLPPQSCMEKMLSRAGPAATLPLASNLIEFDKVNPSPTMHSYPDTICTPVGTKPRGALPYLVNVTGVAAYSPFCSPPPSSPRTAGISISSSIW